MNFLPSKKIGVWHVSLVAWKQVMDPDPWVSASFRRKLQHATAEALKRCLKDRLSWALGFLSFLKLLCLLHDMFWCTVSMGRGFTYIRERISGQALGASLYQCRVCKAGGRSATNECADWFKNHSMWQKLCGWGRETADASRITCLQHSLPVCRRHYMWEVHLNQQKLAEVKLIINALYPLTEIPHYPTPAGVFEFLPGVPNCPIFFTWI